MPCAIASLSLVVASVSDIQAQRRGEAPVAPASALGPVTADATFSVLGLASANDGSNSSITPHNDYWFGATQPLGRLSNVRFSAIGSGNLRAREGVGTGNAAEAMLSLRARARFSGAQVWSAVGYGYANVNNSALLGAGIPGMQPGFTTGFDGVRVDTTVAKRVDVGAISRAEGGILTNMAGIEFSLGVSVERATRVTTQTVTIDETNFTGPLPVSPESRVFTTRTTRSFQRRDIATGIASMGFQAGPSTWLVSVTSPLATWITSDEMAPKPRIAPAIASVAVVQPLTGWLSVVGAAATNSANVGATAMRDDLGDGHNHNFAPVLALGVRIARLPFMGRSDNTPGGILSFETHTIGAVDSATISMTLSSSSDGSNVADHDTLRVVLLIDAPKAESVELMGDATQWIVTQMMRNNNGRWRAELKLTPGVHRITVRADGGRWIAPPNLPLGNDDYGSPVGMIIVKGNRL